MNYLFITSFVYLLLIFFVYFSKKKIESIDNTIYSTALLITMFGIVIDFVQIYFAPKGIDTSILIALNKAFLIYVITWTTVFTLYVLMIGRVKYSKKIVSIIPLWCIAVVLIILLKENYEFVGGTPVVSGPALYVTYTYCGCMIIAMIASTIRKLLSKERIDKSKFIPLLVFITVGFSSMAIQYFYPTLLLTSPAETFITILVYFFIENPDVQMLNNLELARDTAERANKAKTDFLSSMSHEIRTPLNAIVGFSQCIENETTLEAAQSDAKDIIMASQNLLEIVNGILDISKIESGKMELVETDYDLYKIVDDLSKLMVPRIGEKPIKFNATIAPDLPGVLHGDGTKVKQIMSNILTNAVKYTEVGEIKFKVKCINENNHSKIMISVEDTGRGIKQDKIDKLFDKFERLEEDRNTTTEGTGLGLAITKKLVEMMHGKITVQSKYGEGSLFTVYLVQRIVSMERKQEVESLDFYDNFSSKKVLVVDDNKLNIKIATRLLSEYKINVIEAESGASCIEMIENGEKPDLILMDDMMPNMSGTEAMKKIKESGVEIPIVVLTANAIEGMKEKYLEEGFNYYLSKPIDKKELEKVLSMYLGSNPKHESPLGPIPEKMYKITEEDIKEMDELMPRSEIEKIQEQVEKSPVIENVEKVQEPVQNENISIEEPVVIDDAPIKDESLEEKTIVKEDTSNIKNVEFLKNNGIDVDRGLELLGDMEMYNETLQGFLTETDKRVKEMEEFKNNNDMANYAIHAHAMKSDSKYLGFTKLADLSLQHELKGKDNDSNFVNNNYQELMDELNRIVSIVKEYLG